MARLSANGESRCQVPGVEHFLLLSFRPGVTSDKSEGSGPGVHNDGIAMVFLVAGYIKSTIIFESMPLPCRLDDEARLGSTSGFRGDGLTDLLGSDR